MLPSHAGPSMVVNPFPCMLMAAFGGRPATRVGATVAGSGLPNGPAGQVKGGAPESGPAPASAVGCASAAPPSAGPEESGPAAASAPGEPASGGAVPSGPTAPRSSPAASVAGTAPSGPGGAGGPPSSVPDPIAAQPAGAAAARRAREHEASEKNTPARGRKDGIGRTLASPADASRPARGVEEHRPAPRHESIEEHARLRAPSRCPVRSRGGRGAHGPRPHAPGPRLDPRATSANAARRRHEVQPAPDSKRTADRDGADGA